MKSIFAIVIAAAVILSWPSGAYAASGTWADTGSVNASWATAGNWLTGVIPGATAGTANTDVATFNTAAGSYGIIGTPIVIDSGRNIGGMTFNTSAAGSYYIGSTSGNPLLLTSAGTIQTTSSVANPETINAPLVIEGSPGTYTFSSNSATTADTLNFGGGITAGGSSGATVLTLNGSNTGSNTLGGVVANGSSGATLGITKSGGGTWGLSGTNTYTGTTTVSAGTLKASNIQALGGLTAPLTLSGGILDIATDSSINAYNTTVSANSTVIADRATSGAGITQTLGTLSIGANTLNVNAGSNVTSGTAGLAFGPVNLTASGGVFSANSSTQLTLGSVSGLGNSFTVNGAGNTAITGNIATGSGGLTKSGTGTLTLSGNNTYTGATAVNGGILNIQSGNALSGSSGTVVANGAGLQLQGGITTTAEPLTLNGAGFNGGGALENVSGNNAYAGLITLGSDARINSDAGTLTLSNAGVLTGASNALTFGGSGNTTVNSTIDTGITTLTKDGSGILSLAVANTYAGGTALSSGTLNFVSGALGSGLVEFTGNSTLQWASGNTQDISGSLKIDDGVTATLDTSSNTVTLGQPLSLGASGTGALTKAGSGTLILTAANTYSGTTTVSAGTLQIGNGGATGSLGTGNVVDNASLAFDLGNLTPLVIANAVSGTGAVVQNGSGVITLSGTNIYTGTTTVNSGTLKAGIAAQAFGVGSAVTVGAAGTLDLGGLSETVGSLAGSGLVTSSAAGNLILTEGGDTTSTEFAGVIQNGSAASVGLTKTGSGTLTLSGANTYTGPTLISTGTLKAGASSTPGVSGPFGLNSDVTVAGSGTLDLNGKNAAVGSLAGSGTVTSSSAGTAVLTSGSALDNTSSVFSGNIQNGSGSNKVALTKAGSGTLTLSGTNNNYSGGTVINGGTLVAGNPAALGAGAVTNNAGGTLDIGLTGLSLTGPYTQNVNSTLKLNANSASSFGKISVTSGTPSAVTAGSVIDVTVGGYIPFQSTLEIINTNGTGFSGSAAPTTINSSSRFVGFTSSIVNGNLFLTAARTSTGFASFAGNSNALAVGNMLDYLSNPSADMSVIVNSLENQSDAAIGSALNALGPVVDTGVRDTSTAAMDNFIGAALDRVQSISSSLDRVEKALKRPGDPSIGRSSGDYPESSGIWIKPYGSYLSQGMRQGIEGYDAWNGGTALGADRVIFDHFTVGISGGSSYGRVNSKTQDARTDINNAQGAVYAGYQNPDLNYFINAAGTFAWDWYKGQRVITAGSITRMAFSNYDGQQYGTYLGGGYKIKFGDNLELTPLASLQWSHLSLSRYTETNAGALNLNVDSQSYDTVESGLGVGISSEIISYWGIFTPEFHVKWLYDYMNDRIAVNSSLAGGGGSFSSYGATPSKQGVGIGGKLTFDFINDISLIAGLDTELRDGFFGFYGSGTLRYRF